MVLAHWATDLAYWITKDKVCAVVGVIALYNMILLSNKAVMKGVLTRWDTLPNPLGQVSQALWYDNNVC